MYINRLLLLFAICCSAVMARAQLSFSKMDYKAITEKMDASTGLELLYVLYSTEGVKASYKATSSSASVIWYKFGNLGGGYAEEVVTVRDGDTYTIDLSADDMGYIIEEGTTRHYYWVVNYANHMARFDALEIAEDQECDRARLVLKGDAGRITYFTINGASRELSRDLKIDYLTLKYDKDADYYAQVSATQTFASIDGSVGVFAPLCDTYFKLTGDRFLQSWGKEISVESPNYIAIAVDAQTSATQEAREVDNEQKVDAELGGSAPVEISFHAVVSDAAIFREWQMSRDPYFQNIDDRFQQLDFDYTFRENGNIYVRFIANNSAGTCEFESETYEVFIGESNLLCPNVFSPNGDGVNDEWRVSYRSIVEFECHIFNRWGQEVFASTDPAIGWDGRHKGKYVPTGAYYYVVVARGADGRKYRLDGDINIIHSKGHKEGSNSSPE